MHALCVAVLVTASALNLAHSYNVYAKYGAFNVSNSSMQKAVLGALPTEGDVEVIGPTEIWPYLTQGKQPLLLIDNYRMIFSRFGASINIETNKDFTEAGYLIIDKDYFTTYGWNSGLSTLRAKGLIVRVGIIGMCEFAPDCIEIYKFTPRRKT